MFSYQLKCYKKQYDITFLDEMLNAKEGDHVYLNLDTSQDHIIFHFEIIYLLILWGNTLNVCLAQDFATFHGAVVGDSYFDKCKGSDPAAFKCPESCVLKGGKCIKNMKEKCKICNYSSFALHSVIILRYLLQITWYAWFFIKIVYGWRNLYFTDLQCSDFWII